MQAFERLSSAACTLLDDNIDTDVIFPARFLLLMDKKGLGRYFFHDRRFKASGAKRSDSPLDRKDREGAEILIAGANFGCGSSREHAVWALAEFGFRCVIAPSFGEIFYANCFKSGVLPITLPELMVADLAKRAEAGAVFDVDLKSCKITTTHGGAVHFNLDAGRRDTLLNGWDEIDIILNEELPNIERFEIGHKRSQPWLFEEPGDLRGTLGA